MYHAARYSTKNIVGCPIKRSLKAISGALMGKTIAKASFTNQTASHIGRVILHGKVQFIKAIMERKTIM